MRALLLVAALLLLAPTASADWIAAGVEVLGHQACVGVDTQATPPVMATTQCSPGEARIIRLGP